MWHLNWTPDPPDTVVVGIDEVGFGPLAGPVAMAAVAIPVGAVDGVRDSKLISTERARKELADAIRAEATWVQVRQRGAAAINERGLGRCVRELLADLAVEARKKFGYQNVRVVMDGKPVTLPRKIRKRAKIEFQVGADAAVYQVAAASIVAKSHNDANLLGLHKKYPAYNFAQHKGYPTPGHVNAIRRVAFQKMYGDEAAEVLLTKWHQRSSLTCLCYDDEGLGLPSRISRRGGMPVHRDSRGSTERSGAEEHRHRFGNHEHASGCPEVDSEGRRSRTDSRAEVREEPENPVLAVRPGRPHDAPAPAEDSSTPQGKEPSSGTRDPVPRESSPAPEEVVVQRCGDQGRVSTPTGDAEGSGEPNPVSGQGVLPPGVQEDALEGPRPQSVPRDRVDSRDGLTSREGPGREGGQETEGKSVTDPKTEIISEDSSVHDYEDRRSDLLVNPYCKIHGTPELMAEVLRLGPCPAHRRKPVEKALARPEHDRDREVLDIPREEARALAEEAWARREFLSDWQKDFIGDVRRKLERGAEMSPRQNWFIRAAQRESAKRAKRAGAV